MNTDMDTSNNNNETSTSRYNIGVQTPVTKTLRELKQISSVLGTQTTNGISQGGSTQYSRNANLAASAHNLLSQHGIQADKFYSPLSFNHRIDGSEEVAQQQQVEKKFSGGEAKDLDAYLMHHHELILATTLAACADEKEDFSVRMNQMIKEDWEKDQEDLYRELAGFERMDDNVASTLRNGNGSCASLHQFQQRQYQTIEYGGGANYRSREVFGAGSMLSDMGKKHAALVARMNANSEDYAKRGIGYACHEFEEISSSNDGKSQSSYTEAWRLLSEMLDISSTSGLGNNIAFNAPQDTLVSQRAIGALTYVCSRFRDEIIHRMRQTTIAGSGSNNISPSNLADDIASYARANFSLVGKGLLWIQVYLCLRCGDSSAALQTLKSISVNDSKNVVESTIMNLISLLSDNQIKHGAMWKSFSSTNFVVARRDVSELYYRYKTTPSSDESDRYKAAVLALISGSEQIGRSSQVLSTVDDFMFASLWHAVYSDQNTVESIAKMGKMIKKKGPKHFDGESFQKVWNYVYPLLLAQQWGEAITHLASQCGSAGLLEASHLAICLSIENVFNESSLLDDIVASNDRAISLVSMLLVNYSKSFQQTDPEAALQYLVRIPGESRAYTSGSVSKDAKKEIIRLLLDTRAFDILAGKVAADGTRIPGSKGALSTHFTDSDLKSLLAEAANEALKRRNVREAAELLSLSEKYGSLISLLSRELAFYLIEDPSAEKRKFWCDASIVFQQANLSSERKSRVIEVLEEEGMLHVGNTFQMILNLTMFFNYYHEKRWNDASSLIDNLQLFPKTENEIIWKVNQYHSLDRVIQQVISHVILAYTECLSNQYSDIKANSRMMGVSGQALSQRKEELRSRANYLVTFSGKIPSISSDIRGKIGYIEARML